MFVGPNTNTNIIRVQEFGLIRILFGGPLLYEHEYNHPNTNANLKSALTNNSQNKKLRHPILQEGERKKNKRVNQFISDQFDNMWFSN